MDKKLKIQLILGIFITAAIAYFSVRVVRGLQLSVVFRSDINWGLVFLSVVIYIFSNYLRALCYTRGVDTEMNVMTALEVVGIGHALNMVLPVHAGEGMRYVFFPKEYDAKKRTALLVFPALADFLVVVLISLFTAPFARFRDRNLIRAVWILSASCLAAFIIVAVLARFIPRLHKYMEEFPKISMLKMFFWVALSWLIMIAAFWLGLVAFGFRPVKSIRMSLAVFVATNIINLIPASPGGLGLFEYGTVLGLSGLGVDKTAALSASLLLHLIQYAALLPLGAFLYITALHGKYGDSVRNMWRKKIAADETGMDVSDGGERNEIERDKIDIDRSKIERSDEGGNAPNE